MDRSARAVAAFILAGGQSTRMGADKAFVSLDGQTLLQRALHLARSVAPQVQIVGEPAKFSAYAPVVEDVFPGCGPLAGIHAALRVSTAEMNVILAVDIPFIPKPLLDLLIERAGNNPAATVTIPRTLGGWQPLCAVYRREFAALAEKALRAGHYKIDALFDNTSLEPIREEELQAQGFSPDIFRNLNTREELRKATKEVEYPI